MNFVERQEQAAIAKPNLDHFDPAKSFGMGALLGVNPKNHLLVIGAGFSIAQYGLDGAEQWVVLLVFVALASVSVAGSVVYYTVAGERAEGLLNTMKAWLVQNNAAVMTVLLLVFGVILFGQGAGGLTD